MTNPLISEAARLEAGGDWQPQGLLRVYKQSEKGNWAGQVVCIELQFWSAKELGQAVAWAQSNGYKAEWSKSGGQIGQLDAFSTNGPVPMCPVHNSPMRASKEPGAFFCPKRVGGGFCKEKVTH